jgi:hypothetical protein
VKVTSSLGLDSLPVNEIRPGEAGGTAVNQDANAAIRAARHQNTLRMIDFTNFLLLAALGDIYFRDKPRLNAAGGATT